MTSRSQEMSPLKQVDFARGSVGKNIFRTAAPMFVAQFFNLLYNIVDRMFIGRIPGEGTAALGGVGLCFPIITIVLAFSNLFGTGGAPLFAIARGRRDDESAQRIMNVSFFLLSAASVLLTVLGLVFSRQLLTLFGASPNEMQYALPYLRIYLLGTFFSMTATGMNPFLNAQGFSGLGMLTVMVGAFANLILDPVFIFVLDLGVRGAAIATVISQFLSAVFVLAVLRGRKVDLKLRLIRRDHLSKIGGDARSIMGLGLAGFVMQFNNSLVQVICNATLVRYGGDLFVSVMTIVSSVRQMLEIPALAIAEGASPVISYNYGAGRGQNVRKAIRIMSVAGFLYTLVVWLLILWQPAAFIRIFSSDPTILGDAVPALRIYFFAFIFQSLQFSGQTTFKSLNKKGRAIFFSLLRKAVIVIPLTILLPRVAGLGTNGVFMAEPISNVVGGTACFVTMLLTILPELNRMEPSKKKPALPRSALK